MDERRRRAQRGGDPVAIVRHHLRAGEAPLAAWRAALTPDTSYEAALAATRELPVFRSLGARDYACGGSTFRIERLLHRASKIVFCLIPGGTFVMGAQPTDPGFSPEEGPLHRVRVAPYLLARTPCTQEQWDDSRGDLTDERAFVEPDLPIEGVTWAQARTFCERLGLRLPSEAEWEYGCRGGSQRRFCFGNDVHTLTAYAWIDANARNRTQPVGLLRANAFGLHDVHGLVSEWCEDDWHKTYAGAPKTGDPWVDAPRASRRVRRGGHYWSPPSFVHAAYRLHYPPTGGYTGVGLRPAF